MGRFSKLAFWRKSKTDVTPIAAAAAVNGNSKDLADGATEPLPRSSQQELETRATAPLPTLLGTPCKLSFPAQESLAVSASPGTPHEASNSALLESSVDVVTAPTSLPVGHSVFAPAPAAAPAPAPALAPAPASAGPLAPTGEDPSGGRRVSLNSSLRKKDATPRKPVSFDSKVAFDVPPDKLWQEVSEVLGAKLAESLQSSKWDRRVQALKAVAATFKSPKSGRGLQKNEPVRRWRSVCQILNHLMRDKVMPVRLEAHAAFVAAFVNVSGIDYDEVHYALSTLLEHLIDRLGDSNLRLHESARKCVLFTAEQQGLLGLGAVLERLKARLAAAGTSSDRVKVHFGVLDTVDFLLQQFPGHRSEDGEDEDDDDDTPTGTWTQRDVSPFIVAGMCDSLGQRVRASAVKLAVTVHSTFGLDAMQPMLVGLRPAKQQLLKQKFEESEVDDHDKAEASAMTESGKAVSRGGSPVCGSVHKRRPISGQKALGCVSGTHPVTGGLKTTKASPAKAGNVRDMAGHTDAHPAAGRSKTAKAGRVRDLACRVEVEEEDLLMDHILEDVGMVFGGNDACAPGRAFLPGMLDPLLNFEELEEHCLVEEHLRELGLSVNAKPTKGCGRVGVVSCAVPPLNGALPLHIDEDDHDTLLRFRAHSYTTGSKVPPATRMGAPPLAVC